MANITRQEIYTPLVAPDSVVSIMTINGGNYYDYDARMYLTFDRALARVLNEGWAVVNSGHDEGKFWAILKKYDNV